MASSTLTPEPPTTSVLSPDAGPIDHRPGRSQSDRTPSARSRTGRSLSTMQQLVVGAAAVPLIGIVATVAANLFGLVSTQEMVDGALALGEEPGMFVFAAMLWCSPVQWLVGRTQVPVRKLLGILFSGYAISNFSMFVVEEGLADSFSEPFLVAGTVALIAAIPLLATSGRWAQRAMGMRRWRKLHKLTYFIAAALIAHLLLIGEFSISLLLIVPALIVRIPPVAAALKRVGQRRRALTSDGRACVPAAEGSAGPAQPC